MAIADSVLVNAASSGTPFSITVPSGTTHLLVLAAARSSSDFDPVSMTWNGAAMSAVDLVNSDGTQEQCWAFCTDNPTTGTHNLAWSQSGGSNAAWIVAIAVSSGDTGTALATAKAVGGFSASLTAAAADRVYGIVDGWNATEGSVDSPGTSLSSGIRSLGVSSYVGAAYRDGAGGSTTLSWTVDADTAGCILLVKVTAATGGGGGSVPPHALAGGGAPLTALVQGGLTA